MGTVVITGGAGRVGSAVVRAVQALGRRAVSMDLRENPEADQSIAVDVTDEVALAAAFAEIGALSGLVCAVEMAMPQRIEDMSWQDWRRVMVVNVGGAMLAMKHASPRLQSGGAVVLLASVAAHKGVGGNAAYHTAKGAVLGLMRASCGEFAARGIRVNAVSPGFITSDFRSDGLSYSAAGTEGKVYANAVAEAVMFLLSEDASFVTGTEVIVDAGLTRRA